jgi:Co/Zn/Cd efflux system component
MYTALSYSPRRCLLADSGLAAVAATRLLPNDPHTYGWPRGSIFASFINAVIVPVAMGSLG